MIFSFKKYRSIRHDKTKRIIIRTTSCLHLYTAFSVQNFGLEFCSIQYCGDTYLLLSYPVLEVQNEFVDSLDDHSVKTGNSGDTFRPRNSFRDNHSATSRTTKLSAQREARVTDDLSRRLGDDQF